LRAHDAILASSTDDRLLRRTGEFKPRTTRDRDKNASQMLDAEQKLFALELATHAAPKNGGPLRGVGRDDIQRRPDRVR
jgi:hypothetical protein